MHQVAIIAMGTKMWKKRSLSSCTFKFHSDGGYMNQGTH